MTQVAITEKQDEIIQWVTFRLEGETYGINVMQVREVLRYSEIAPVPGAPGPGESGSRPPLPGYM